MDILSMSSSKPRCRRTLATASLMMDKKLWTPPADRIKDAAAFERAIDRVLQACQPEYWASREKRLARRLEKPTRTDRVR